MAEFQYEYAIRSERPPPADRRYRFTSQWARSNGGRSEVPPWHYVARDAARNIYHKFDGASRDWPVTVEIWDPKGESIGTFGIDCIEHDPEFEVTDA